MFLSILLILAGIGLLLLGGEGVVRGGSSIAAKLRVPAYIIGATVVAFGTSAPELAVTLTASLKGAPGLALGNVVGSNIANLGLILGLAALLRPIVAPVENLRSELPFIGAVVVLLVLFGWDSEIARWEGIVLLTGMAVYMMHTLRSTRKARRLGNHNDEVQHYRMMVAVPMTLVGLVALYGGGELLVKGAVQIAEAMGVRQWVIGVLIVAIGTSMPEVAASVVAAYRGRGDLAVGNVIGSNLFNTFLVLGTGATISPMRVTTNIRPDLVIFALLTVLIVGPMLRRGNMSRTMGIIALAAYFGYALLQATMNG